MRPLFTLLIIMFAWPVHGQDALSRNFSMFPGAVVAPPVYGIGADGKRFLPGWEFVEGPDLFFQPQDGGAAGFLQINRQNDGYNVDTFFDHLIAEANLSEVERPPGQVAEAFGAVFGPFVAAVFGAAVKDGNPVKFFADLHGPDDNNNVTGTLMYGSAEVFESWDGVLLPLVFNGYVKDPDIFENRAVMRAGSDAQKTQFYVGMVNKKIMSEYGALTTLSSMAMQAARNATTVAGCAGASNCSVSYDGSGNAVADFDSN